MSTSNKPIANAIDSITVFQNVMRVEAEALLTASESVDGALNAAIEAILDCQGRVIVAGLGKTGYVARKAAATFCSTGTPALFLHPTEALHGDLGVVTPDDVFLALSNSGETDEIISLLPCMIRIGVPIIGLTGNSDSTLAKRSQIVLETHVDGEADQFSVTPTCSTTVMMAMCDALAVTLMGRKGFTPEQFAIFHPAGNLGRRLLVKVADLMRVGDHMPTVAANTTVSEAVHVITQKRMGAVIVVSSDQAVVGIMTDGDLRRAVEHGLSCDDSQADQTVDEVMTRSPHKISAEALAAEALKMMEDQQITVLPVCQDAGQLVGVIHLHDLIRAGLA
jgi:arabinose-5-phosphate isomerase